MSNIVYIATSLDGYIADSDGGLDWLQTVPNPHQDDLGFNDFMAGIDALVMGRNTFDVVCGFGGEWPYPKPVFVLSSSLKEIPDEYRDKAELVSGSLDEVVASLHQKGFRNLYIDGGKTVQGFHSKVLFADSVGTNAIYCDEKVARCFTSCPETDS